MKMYKLFFYITFPVLALFFSCKKETSVENHLSSFSNITDSNYLDRCYDIYDPGTGIDTQEITVFDYDNAKRIVSIINSDISDPSFVATKTYRFYYSGSDTIPYKTFFLSNSFGGDYDSITTFHFYDNQLRKIKDSILESKVLGVGSYYYKYKALHNYSYLPGKIYILQEQDQIVPAYGISLSRDTAVVDVNGDIIQNKIYNFNGISYDLVVTSDFIYDNHKSPFAKLSFFRSDTGLPNGETLFFEYLSYKNRITQHENVSGINFTDASYNYTYNTSGLPTLCNILFNGGPEKIIFTYKNL